MNFGSVCSGIEAASVAWHPLGWRASFVSEIEKFPCAVLAHHYPDVPNLGDMTRFMEWPDAAIDVLVGGTPCQSFSVAGLRKGLDDPRGNLMLTYGAIAGRYRPRWLVWENVPGVLSSNGGRDFGTFLGMLAELGYGFAYRVLDAQYFGVAQRRRRVFVVGYLGDWRRAAAVLFERHSLQGHSAPSRKAREDAANCLRARANSSHRADSDNFVAWPAEVACTLNAAFGSKQGLEDQHALGGGSSSFLPSVAMCLNAGAMGRQDAESETLIPTFGGVFDVTPFDTTQITSPANYSSPKSGDACHPLAAGMHAPAIAFSCKDHGADAGEVAPTLRSMGHDGSHANGGGQVAVAFAIGSHAGCADGDQTNRNHVGGGPVGSNISEELAYSLRAGRMQSVAAGMAVRRLTPVECERLQGFADDYTAIPWRGKDADACPDGPRYKALGNSMAVPCMVWLGERIQAVEEIIKEQARGKVA